MGLCEAAIAMHERGVVHRDVKPDNVLLTSVITSANVSDDDAVLALCDLGGAADFETGQGCDGREAIFDPVYGA